MNKVRRVQPEFEEPDFPQWNHPPTVGGFIVGSILWVLMVVAFLFLFYIQLIRHHTHYLLSFIKNSLPQIPFWLAVIVGVFFAPAALIIIVVGAVVKLLND